MLIRPREQFTFDRVRGTGDDAPDSLREPVRGYVDYDECTAPPAGNTSKIAVVIVRLETLIILFLPQRVVGALLGPPHAVGYEKYETSRTQMNCPDCNHVDTSIRDTRTIENGDAIRRRREPDRCQFRFTTYERNEWESVRVRKRDRPIEPYDRGTVRTGVEVAREKRPVTPQAVSEPVEAVTAEIEGGMRG